jgi:predicted AAA+ superfamily ATPase
MLDPRTRQRELTPLQQIAPQAAEQGIQRIIVTYDTVGLGTVDGIEIVNAIDWLLGS